MKKEGEKWFNQVLLRHSSLDLCRKKSYSHVKQLIQSARNI